MSTIDLMGVSKRYGAVGAVEDIDLHVGQGELVTVLGPERLGQDDTADADRRALQPSRPGGSASAAAT